MFVKFSIFLATISLYKCNFEIIWWLNSSRFYLQVNLSKCCIDFDKLWIFYSRPKRHVFFFVCAHTVVKEMKHPLEKRNQFLHFWANIVEIVKNITKVSNKNFIIFNVFYNNSHLDFSKISFFSKPPSIFENFKICLI